MNGVYIGFTDLDPEVTNKIKSSEADIEYLKQEIDVLRHIINIVKGISRENIDHEFKKVREEVRGSFKEMLQYI